jgi:hypothetical protein
MNESVLGEIGFHFAVLSTVNNNALPLWEDKSTDFAAFGLPTGAITTT